MMFCLSSVRTLSQQLCRFRQSAALTSALNISTTSKRTQMQGSPMIKPNASAVAFPYIQTDKTGNTYVVDRPKAEELGELYEIKKQYTAQGIGFGATEFNTFDDFLEYYKDKDNLWIKITEESTNDFLGYNVILPGFLNRSTHPMTCCGYIMVLPGKGGKGSHVAQAFLDVGIKAGYYGILFRVNVDNMPMFLMCRKKFGSINLGVTPASANVKGTGWIDSYNTYFPINTGKNGINEIKFLDPVILMNPTMEDIKPDSWQVPFEGFECKMSNGQRVRITAADLTEKLAVEKYLQELAKQGRRIGLDEFTEDGVFNRKFFRESLTLVAESTKGELCGAAIIGPSTLNRETPSFTLQVYTLAPQNKELEAAFIKCAHKTARQQQMLGLITDVFPNDVQHYKSLRDLGFYTTASFPHSAFLQNEGYTDSLIMYLPTDDVYSAQL